MDLFWKTTAAVLLALILGLALGKQQKDISVLFIIAVCCMTGMSAISLLEPVLDFLYELKALTRIEDAMLTSLIKIVGIALVSELVSVICADAGSSSLGKGLQLAASAAILYLSIPMFHTVFSMIREMLGVL